MEFLAETGLVTESLLFLCAFLVTRVSLERLSETRLLPRSSRRPPPSPPGWPVVGNVSLFMGPEMPCEKLQRVAEKLGDVVAINIGPVRMLVLGSTRAVREAFVKKGDDFSGRPSIYTMTLLTRNGRGIAFGDYSPTWKEHKRLVTKALRLYLTPRPPVISPTSKPDIADDSPASLMSAARRNRHHLSLVEEVMLSEAQHLCRSLSRLTDRPTNLTRQLTIAITNVVCRLSFGRRYDDDDPELWQFAASNDNLKDIFQPGHPVDVFPFLKVFPWQRLRVIDHIIKIRDVILLREYERHLETFDPENIRDFTDALLRHHRDENQNDVASTSHIAAKARAGSPVETLRNAGAGSSGVGAVDGTSSSSSDDEFDVDSGHDDGIGMDKDAVLMAMWEVFTGGFETSLQTMRWAIAYLVHYPEVQRKLQRDLERVLPCGSGPVWGERRELPYLEAAVLDTLRHSSMSSLNGPHRVSRDTCVAGYDVAKDTTVFCNLWAIHHNPAVWKDPWNFNPENFLNEKGAVFVPQDFMPFSVGPRQCSGDKLAKMSLFIFFGALLQNFVFEPSSENTLPELKPKGVEPIRVIGEYDVVLRPRTRSGTPSTTESSEISSTTNRSFSDRVRETGQ